jgi:putative transposase
MKKTQSLYHGHRFPAAVISHAVRWYFRFHLSLRDIEELLFEHGVVVSYESVRRWCGQIRRELCPSCQSGAAQAGQHLASRRDVRDAAR